MSLMSTKYPLCLLLVFMIFGIADAVAKNQARFKIKFLPPLKTPLGESISLIAKDMNDSGQVIGEAMGYSGWRTGFLYTPGQGIRQVDPSGQFRTVPWRIINVGLVIGRDFSSRQYAIFSYDERNGYQSLTQGLSESIKKDFKLIDMNEAGVMLLAAFGSPQQNHNFPYRYTPGRGWENVHNVIPKLREFSIIDIGFSRININGDFKFYNVDKNGVHNYVYYENSGKLVDLTPMFSVGNINDSGWVVGTYYKFTEPPVIRPINGRPYLYIPGMGIRNIRPTVKGQSSAHHISGDGTVAGCMEGGNGECNSLFTYDKNEGHTIVDEAKFRALLRRNMPFVGITIDFMNDRREIIGSVITVDSTGHETAGAYYLYTQEQGLRDLQVLVNQVRSNVRISDIVDLNNRGQILLRVDRSGTSTAVLTPNN